MCNFREASATGPELASADAIPDMQAAFTPGAANYLRCRNQEHKCAPDLHQHGDLSTLNTCRLHSLAFPVAGSELLVYLTFNAPRRILQSIQARDKPATPTFILNLNMALTIFICVPNHRCTVKFN